MKYGGMFTEREEAVIRWTKRGCLLAAFLVFIGAPAALLAAVALQPSICGEPFSTGDSVPYPAGYCEMFSPYLGHPAWVVPRG
jgi:hypothetical protein